jgi:hypothetical protein
MKERRPAPYAHAPRHYAQKGGYVPKAVRAKEFKQTLRARYRNLLSKKEVQGFRAGVFVAGEEVEAAGGDGGGIGGGGGSGAAAGGALAARAPPPRPQLASANAGGSRFSGAAAEAARRGAARDAQRSAAERAANSRAAALVARSKQRGAFKRKNARGQPLLSARMPFLLARVEGRKVILTPGI